MPEKRTGLVSHAALPVLVALFCGASAVRGSLDSGVADAMEQKDADVVRRLLQQHADVNAQQPDGATALHWAAHWDDAESALLLISKGASVDAANEYGVTPLDLACDNAGVAMVSLLLKAGANPNATPATGETALMKASRTGNVRVIESLLAAKADVNLKDRVNGQTALMWAVSERHPQIARALIAAGADVNARSTGGFTPLLFAARGGELESARLLLEAGAKIDDAALDGATPLVVASAGRTAIAGRDYKISVSPSGHEALAVFLLAKGADPARTDSLGRTPLHLAVETSKTGLIKELIAHGANLNARMAKDEPPLAGDFVARNGFAGATPFWLAARASDVEMMRLLASAGADPALATNGQITPLMVAIGANQNESRLPPEDRILEAVKLCVQMGNDVNQTAANGQTPAHFATEMGEDNLIQFLFGRGAKLDVKDRRGQTPLDIALTNPSRPRPKTAALLRKLLAMEPAQSGQ